jgi:hypothetical protein
VANIMDVRVPALLYFIFVRVCGWPVPLSLSTASKDAGLFVLLHEIAARRRSSPGHAIPAAPTRRSRRRCYATSATCHAESDTVPP